MIAAVVSLRWEPKLLECPTGPVEVFLHYGTGWVLSPVPSGWIAAHSITGAIVRAGTRPRVWVDKTRAMLELEQLCPDCYAVDLAALCKSCEGTGQLGGRKS